MASKAKQTGEQAADSSAAVGEDANDAGRASSDPGGEGNGLFSELTDTARDATLAILKPAIKSAAESATNYAVTKGPELLKDQVGPKLEQAGGLAGMADKALSNAGPLGKVASTFGMGGKLVDNITPGDDEDGGEADLDATGSGRRMPVQQAIDVAVPLEVAYNQWTQFEEYPSFMHRVDSATQGDDTHVTFTEKVWGFGRDFEAEIVEQRPNERITWRSVSGLKNAGIVTFHELADRLTRIEVTVDFKPESLFQKLARGTRFSKRAIRADMHRFKAYVELAEEEDGAWLGRIEDAEVVQDHEQAQEERNAERAESEDGAEGAESEQEPDEESEAPDEEAAIEEEASEEEDAEEEEAEAEAEDESEAEAQDESEASEEEPEEETPARRRPRRPQRRRQPPARRQGAGQKRGTSQGRPKTAKS